jgi:hypothetical protein
VYANIFVLDHDSLRLRQCGRDEQLLAQIQSRCAKPGSQIVFFTVVGYRQTLYRAHIDAGIALDAARRLENCLYVAVQTSLDFARGLLRVKPEFDLDVQVPEALRQFDVLHLLAR